MMKLSKENFNLDLTTVNPKKIKQIKICKRNSKLQQTQIMAISIMQKIPKKLLKSITKNKR